MLFAFLLFSAVAWALLAYGISCVLVNDGPRQDPWRLGVGLGIFAMLVCLSAGSLCAAFFV